MNARRVMPVGEQSFEDLRSRRCVYVDKTQYIYNLVSGSKFYFLSRPRRFGKSLLLSTLEAYFLGKKDLLKGLYLEQAEPELAASEDRPPWEEHPVLYLDLSDNNNKFPQTHSINLNDQLSGWEKIYGTAPSEVDFTTRFRGVIRRAYEQTGQQVVLLVDEYDEPLLDTLQIPGLHADIRDTLHGFYSVIKGSSKYLRFVFLTGVTRFVKMGIFSSLNNLNDITMTPAYSGICGITETELKTNFAPEIEALAIKLQRSSEQTLSLLKRRYDGYLFSEEGENVYNPFSLLRVFDANYVDDYWYETGTPTFLVEKLKKERLYFPNFEKGIIVERTKLKAYNTDSQEVIPVLFQAGYLTIKAYRAVEEDYVLGFPNDEVKYSFLGNIQPILAPLPESETGASVWKFRQAIETGDVELMMENIEAILTGIPYDNINEVRYRERDAQVALYIIFTLIGKSVETEVHNLKGRADIIVHAHEVIYILELKLWSAGTPEEAIAQIRSQEYATRYKGTHKRILLIGASFDQEKRNIGAWKVEEF